MGASSLLGSLTTASALPPLPTRGNNSGAPTAETAQGHSWDSEGKLMALKRELGLLPLHQDTGGKQAGKAPREG